MAINLEERKNLKDAKEKKQNSPKPYCCFHPTPETQVMQLHPHFHPLRFLPFCMNFSWMENQQHGHHQDNYYKCL